MINKQNGLANMTRYSDLRWKLKSLDIYNDVNFKVTDLHPLVILDLKRSCILDFIDIVDIC